MRSVVAWLVVCPLLGALLGSPAADAIIARHGVASAPAEARLNDQMVPAGRLANGVLTVALDLTRATWRPNGPDGVAIDVAAIAERGQAPPVPGPLIRVPEGTRVEASVRNLLDSVAVVRGLREHDGGNDSLVLAPGAEQLVRFTASRVGTHFYLARITRTPTLLSRRDDSLLVAALVVDPAPRTARAPMRPERIWVITAWDDSGRVAHSLYGPRQVYAINGRSWPHTERLT